MMESPLVDRTQNKLQSTVYEDILVHVIKNRLILSIQILNLISI